MARAARETPIEARCVKIAEAHGFEFPKLVPHRRGRPDRILICSYLPSVYVELKTGDGVLSPSQIAEHDRLSRYGFSVVTIRSAEQFLDFLTQWKHTD